MRVIWLFIKSVLKCVARTGVGLSIVVIGCRIIVLTATQFVPRVVRKSVTIGIARDINNTGLTTTVLRVTVQIKRIAKYPEIAFSCHVAHSVVKTECDISAPSSESNQPAVVIGNSGFALTTHCLGIVANLILRQHIDKLSHSRLIFINAREIFATRSRSGIGCWQIVLHPYQAEMSGNITRLCLPTVQAREGVTMERTRRDIILRIGDINAIVCCQ